MDTGLADDADWATNWHLARFFSATLHSVRALAEKLKLADGPLPSGENGP